MLRAVVRRTRAGLSPLAADKGHLHHRMLDIGHSHRATVLILYAWAALFTGVVIGLSILKTKLVVLAGTTVIAVLVLVLLSIPRLRWWERRSKPAPAAAPAPLAAPVPTRPAGRGRHDFSVTEGSIANSGIGPTSLQQGGTSETGSADPTGPRPATRASGTIVPLSGAAVRLPIDWPEYGPADSGPH
jgi:UDP-GlcNAc:undecaprenyl-phosphate GlcNAc-1-phosphate transferase